MARLQWFMASSGLLAAVSTMAFSAQRLEAQDISSDAQDDITKECPAGGISNPNGGDCAVYHGDHIVRYIIHVPQNYQVNYVNKNKKAPLLLDLVGSENDPNHQRQTSGQLKQSDRIGFIAVWPKPPHLNDNWDSNDEQYLRDIISDVKRDYPDVDAKRVYVTGHSQGGRMTQVMGCHASDVVRAIAPTSFELPDTNCRQQNISVTTFHGSADPTVGYGEPYDPGSKHGPRADGSRIPVPGGGERETLRAWARLNGCADPGSNPDHQFPFDNSSYVQSATGCGKDKFNEPVKVRLVTVLDADHGIYPSEQQNNDNAVNIAAYIWDKVFDGS